jgi:hypothetical protein
MRPSVTAELTDGALVVRCHGLAVPGTLRWLVEVPRERIAGARLVERREATALLGWRIGGTFLTRTRFIGGFFTVRGVKGGRQWWAAPAGDPVLVVTLRDHRWTRVVVRVPGQEVLADQL